MHMIFDEEIETLSFKERLILHHGSRDGLKGRISPNHISARSSCDFGKGFYLGTSEEQVKSLSFNGQNPTYYKIEADFSGLSCIYLHGIAWALMVASNRHPELMSQYPNVSDFFCRLEKSHDVIIGKIADDRIFDSLEDFLGGSITDKAAIACLNGLDLGDQYVIKTQAACDGRLLIRKEKKLSSQEIEIFRKIRKKQREQGNAMANRILKAWRRQGKYIDEILDEAEKAYQDDGQIQAPRM